MHGLMREGRRKPVLYSTRAVQHEQQIDGVRIINPFKVGDIGDLLA
jgi:hypothetical protein